MFGEFFRGGGAVGLQGERREDESSLTEFRILQSLMEGSGKYYFDTAEIPPPPSRLIRQAGAHNGLLDKSFNSVCLLGSLSLETVYTHDQKLIR